MKNITSKWFTKNKMDDVVLYFKNYSSTAQTLDLFNIATSPQLINQYRFTTPYSASYSAGTVRFTMDSADYSGVITAGLTAQQLADLLTSLGAGTWSVESDATNGNIFYVNSNTNVYTELEITASMGTTTFTVDNSISLTSSITLAGTAGKIVYIDWGDGNTTTVTLNPIAAAYPHTYASATTHTVELSGQVDEITQMDGTNDTFTAISFVGTYSQLTNISFSTNAITSVTLLSTMTTVDTIILGSNQLTTIDLTGLVNIGYFDGTDNLLTQAAVDYILAFLDTNGVVSGQCYLDTGANASPSAAGLTSKSNLEAKGWTVTVN